MSVNSDEPRSKRKKKTPQKKSNRSWIISVFFIAVLLSSTISFLSSSIMEDAELVEAFIVLLVIVFLGILFDIIGVAVMSANEKPFHSMAAKKVPGAAEALKLLRNAEKVSNFCNDVIGDICGVISGSAAATIAARVLAMHPGMREIVLTLAMSALAAGLTVGGKACGKSFAIDSSTSVVRTAAMVLHFFHTIPEKLRPKRRR